MTEKSRTSQTEFDKIVAKANKNAANADQNHPAQNYILKGGIPHKLVNGVLIPFTKMS